MMLVDDEGEQIIRHNPDNFRDEQQIAVDGDFCDVCISIEALVVILS
jgi:cytochrome c-type biogenesis protein CcmE